MKRGFVFDQLALWLLDWSSSWLKFTKQTSSLLLRTTCAQTSKLL